MSKLRKFSSSVRDVVKSVRGRTKEEIEEISQHAQKQVIDGAGEVHPPENSQQTTSVVAEAMQQTSQPPLSDEEKRKMNLQHIDRTKKLEEEIENYRKRRIEGDRERWVESQGSSNLIAPGEPMLKPLDVPQSKPSRGKIPGVPGTAKGGTGPEVRKSKQ